MTRASLVTILLTSVLGMGACGDSRQPPSSPLSPTPTAPAPAPRLEDLLSSYDEKWSLTTVLIAVTGDACSGSSPIGTTVSGQMAAARSDTSVRFLYWVSNYPSDDIRYNGSIRDGQFSAESALYAVRFPFCVGEGSFQGHVAGRFSNGGRHLEAIETWSYHFPASDFQLTISWTADRQ